MISVWISGEQREGIDEGWIARRVQGLRRDGEPVCVRVTARGEGVDILVTAGDCPPGAGGSREASPREASLLQLWDGCGVRGDSGFALGRLVQCLRRLERAL